MAETGPQRFEEFLEGACISLEIRLALSCLSLLSLRNPCLPSFAILDKVELGDRSPSALLFSACLCSALVGNELKRRGLRLLFCSLLLLEGNPRDRRDFRKSPEISRGFPKNAESRASASGSDSVGAGYRERAGLLSVLHSSQAEI